MNNLDRQFSLVLVLFAALLGVSLWSLSALNGARASAESRGEDLADSRRLAERIISMRREPTLAASAQPRLELTGRIEQAAREADLPEGSLDRIGAEQQQRLDADTSRRTRQLFLRDVTLQQLITFLHTLTAEAGGLQIQSIRLVAPRDAREDADDRWNSEVVASYTLFDPASDGPRRRP